MNSSRRTFVLGALSLPFASVAPPLLGRTATATQPERKLLLVRDISITDGARFLTGWPSVGTQTLAFERNVSALLIEQLVPTWRREGVSPIAGLTDARAFFCLSHMAGDHGLRLIYRRVHERSDGEAQGSRRTVDIGQTDWLSHPAREIMQALGGRRRQAMPIPELLPDDSVLVSWLMVPRGHIMA